jgi:hypothetical protein
LEKSASVNFSKYGKNSSADALGANLPSGVNNCTIWSLAVELTHSTYRGSRVIRWSKERPLVAGYVV